MVVVFTNNVMMGTENSLTNHYFRLDGVNHNVPVIPLSQPSSQQHTKRNSKRSSKGSSKGASRY